MIRVPHCHHNPVSSHSKTSKRIDKSPVNTGDFVFLRPRAYYQSHVLRGGTFRGIWFFKGGYFSLPGHLRGVEMSLTDTEVRRSKPTEKAYRLSDGGSLYLWVTPAGGKLWRWAYNKVPAGGLGNVTALLTSRNQSHKRTTPVSLVPATGKGINPCLAARCAALWRGAAGPPCLPPNLRRDQNLRGFSTLEQVRSRWTA
jgi:hypothetical protein